MVKLFLVIFAILLINFQFAITNFFGQSYIVGQKTVLKSALSPHPWFHETSTLNLQASNTNDKKLFILATRGSWNLTWC